jgi:hypothetical protein
MVTDRGRSYDAQAFDGVTQQQCLAHMLRSIQEVLKTKKGRARDVGERLQALWQDAIQLWRGSHPGEVAAFAVQAQRVQDTITPHLRNRCLTAPDNQRVLKHIGRHHDRGTLLRFLEDPHIEPTNNRAERALRPAVIARKGSQCSKNAPGAHAVAAFTRVVRTVAQQGIASLVEGLYQLFRSAPLHTAPPDSS